MVGKKGLFELKKCTVSGLKRQFDKWHLFSAPTGGGAAALCDPNPPRPFAQSRSKMHDQEGRTL